MTHLALAAFKQLLLSFNDWFFLSCPLSLRTMAFPKFYVLFYSPLQFLLFSEQTDLPSLVKFTILLKTFRNGTQTALSFH